MQLSKSYKHLLFLTTIIVAVFTCTFFNSVTLNAQEVTVLPTTATWNFFHPTDGVDPAIADADYDTTWFTQDIPGNTYNGPAFANSGSGLFGYGTINFGPITTPIGTGNPPTIAAPAGGDRYTAYFTTTFDLGAIDADTIVDLSANVLGDDGVIIYLNGQRAGELNMDGAIEAYQTFAAGVGNETTLTNIILDHTLLVDGINTLSVSSHQANANSSDIGFQLEAVATVEPIPEPSTIVLAILGIVGGVLLRKRR